MGTYVQISMKFTTLYFSMNLKQQKNCRSGGTYAQFFINVMTMIFFLAIFFITKFLNKANLDITISDTARVAPPVTGYPVFL